MEKRWASTAYGPDTSCAPGTLSRQLILNGAQSAYDAEQSQAPGGRRTLGEKEEGQGSQHEDLLTASLNPHPEGRLTHLHTAELAAHGNPSQPRCQRRPGPPRPGPGPAHRSGPPVGSLLRVSFPRLPQFPSLELSSM